MRFLVDNQLPNTLAVWLRSKNHQAEHVLEVNLAQSKDSPIWHYAHQQGAAVITKDEDFAEWVRRGRTGPQVIWLRIGNTSTRHLLQWFEPILPVIVRRLEEGERLIEVR